MTVRSSCGTSGFSTRMRRSGGTYLTLPGSGVADHGDGYQASTSYTLSTRGTYRFDIRRSPNLHMGFGGYGRHHCLGAQLARLELYVLFDELLDRLPDIALAEPDAPLDMRRGSFVLGLESLPVVLEGS